MKVLVVRLSAIGDVVHTLPVLAALTRAGHTVSWLVEPPAHPLLSGLKQIDRVVRAPWAKRFTVEDARKTVRALREDRADVALELQGLWKSAAWARLSGARRVIGHARAARKEALSAVLLHEELPLPSGITHVIDKNLALLRGIGIEAVGQREFPLASASAAESVERQMSARGLREIAILNPGGGWSSKLWSPESMGALAPRLRDRGLTPVVTWGPAERALAERVVAASGGAAELCFETSILELVELARRARLMVAADTGPLHLACAVGTPVVALFGPTDPARNGPFSPEDVVVRKAPACAPCHRRKCAVHDGVMNAITVEEVARAVDMRLDRSTAARSAR